MSKKRDTNTVVKKEYAPLPGASYSRQQAEILGRILEALPASPNKQPALLVEECEPDDHPLHGLFEWDNVEAGHKYRLAQARRHIRTLHIEYIRADNTKTTEAAFISIPQKGAPAVPRQQPRLYISLSVARTDPEQRGNAVRLALRDLEAWCERFRPLAFDELSPVFDAVEDVRRALEDGDIEQAV